MAMEVDRADRDPNMLAIGISIFASKENWSVDKTVALATLPTM
jgi:hypothetical protein